MSVLVCVVGCDRAAHLLTIFVLYVCMYVCRRVYVSIFVSQLFCSADVESFKVGLQLCLQPSGRSPRLATCSPSQRGRNILAKTQINSGLEEYKNIRLQLKSVPPSCVQQTLISQVCLSPESEKNTDKHQHAQICSSSISIQIFILALFPFRFSMQNVIYQTRELSIEMTYFDTNSYNRCKIQFVG